MLSDPWAVQYSNCHVNRLLTLGTHIVHEIVYAHSGFLDIGGGGTTCTEQGVGFRGKGNIHQCEKSIRYAACICAYNQFTV